MFLVIVMKSRTFSSFSYSANEQVCTNQEGAQPNSWPNLANGNIPQHGCHIQFTNGGWRGGRNLSFLLLWIWILSGPSVWTFTGIQSLSGVSRNSENLQVWHSTIAAQGLTANQSLGGEKIVFHIVCFANSLWSLFLSLVLLILLI